MAITSTNIVSASDALWLGKDVGFGISLDGWDEDWFNGAELGLCSDDGRLEGEGAELGINDGM